MLVIEKDTPKAANIPMPPSFVALPPKQIMIRDIGNSRAFKINSPNPYVVVKYGFLSFHLKVLIRKPEHIL